MSTDSAPLRDRADRETSVVEGNQARDASGNHYELRWQTSDAGVAARSVKRGAIVGERLPGELISWFPEPPAGTRASAKSSRAWLESLCVGRGPTGFSVWQRPRGTGVLVLLYPEC